MKRYKNKLRLIGFISVIIAMSSCKKDVEGCTDSTATNYNASANSDNGSCNYVAEISFWYDNATRDSLIANGVGSVTPFIDGTNLINVYPIYSLWSSQPDCKTNAVRLTVDLGHEKSKSVIFKVAYDSLSNVVLEDTFMMTNGECELYQIVW